MKILQVEDRSESPDLLSHLFSTASEWEYWQRIANAVQAPCDQTGNESPPSERVSIWVKIAPQSHGDQAFWSDATAFWGKLFKVLVELRSSV